MANEEVDEDSIDLETLQAQIDMSMSFAQEMVSSWVKPSKRLQSKANKDIEAELKDYMHRPPRLGVGATISESHISSRDIARLKGHIIGKGQKRPREEPHKSAEVDDEEESRTNVIKKKARVDPFSDAGKKKGRKPVAEGGVSSLLKPPATTEEEQAVHEIANTVTNDAVGQSLPVTTSKRKKKKKRHSESSPPKNPPIDAESLASDTSPVIVTELVDTSLAASEQDIDGPTPRIPMMHNAALTSIFASPLHIRRLVRSTALLQQPLLNLGPPGSDDGFENVVEAKSDDLNSGMGKKKRRKRRKKKIGGNDATMEPTPFP